MPIPSPRKDEEKKDFIGRCMSDGVMVGEYPDSSQRAAICNASWEKPEMSNEIKAEIFAVGKWNGMQFDAADLQEIVKAFKKLGDAHKVPLKLGHNDEQKKTDGEPALGWVSDIWVEGNKLFAKFTDLPDIMMEAINKNLYRKVSIELDAGVKYKADFFKYVLSGVAILGADLPAVNVLADLKAYLSKAGLSHKRDAQHQMTREKVLTFTYNEEDTMSDELKAQVAEMQRKLDEANAKVLQFSKSEEARKENEKKMAFEADKKAFEQNLDALVKDGILLPAQREKFMAGVKEDNLEAMKFSVAALSEGKKKPADKSDDSSISTKKDGDQETGTPDKIVCAKAKKAAMDHKVSFSRAMSMVLESDPELAQAYKAMNGG